MKNKIAFVSNSSFSLWNFRYPIMKKLKELGFLVYAVAPEDEFSEKLSHEFEFVPLKRLDRKGTNPIKELLFLRELINVYRKINPDLIFHFTIKPNIWGSIASGLLGVPSVAVVTGLGYVFTETDKKHHLRFLVKFLYKTAFKFSYKVIFLNSDDVNIFENNNLVTPQKIKVIISEGIDTEHFKPEYVKRNESLFKFIYIGRFLWDKGLGELIKASEMLKAEGYKFELIMIGDVDKGNPASVTKETIDKWKKKDYIKILGFQKDVRPFLAESDCLILPSYYREGVPRVVLEAMSMAKPVIVTDAPGCRETVINGINGFLIKPKDVESLKEAMKKMMNLPPESRKKMGEAGRNFALKKFDVKIIVDEYIKLIEEILNRK